jgi:uncharacterized protein YegP (UPF0339 family)/predicted RNase H-like HicB family nuclease
VAKFVIYADTGGHYRWKLVASNGRTTASSGESFASKSNAREAAERVKAHAAKADVEAEEDSDAAGSEAITVSVTVPVDFEDAGDGWILAQVPGVPGAISQGRTRAEARENVIDALQTVLTPDRELSRVAKPVVTTRR